MRTVIVSGADARYFPLLADLVTSIRARAMAAGMAVAALDCGLHPQQIRWLWQQGVVCVRPEPDYPEVETPGAWYLAMSARPHLPRWVPGHDLYVWIDADAWVQDWTAIEWLTDAAMRFGTALVAETDRAFAEAFCQTPDTFDGPSVRFRFDLLRQLFGETVARRLYLQPMLNSGLLALRVDSPVWGLWSGALRQALALRPGRAALFMAEQTALNVVLYEQSPGFARLPAWCNWTCHRAWPRVAESGELLEAEYPFRPLGIVHLTAKTKNGRWPLRRLDGEVVTRSLRFPRATASQSA